MIAAQRKGWSLAAAEVRAKQVAGKASAQTAYAGLVERSEWNGEGGLAEGALLWLPPVRASRLLDRQLDLQRMGTTVALEVGVVDLGEAIIFVVLDGEIELLAGDHLEDLVDDADYDPDERAWYYARVVENPTCRWSTRDCNTLGTAGGELPQACETAVDVIQERAWTGPIWN